MPPKSFVMLYLPSEKAPAPPKPLIIEQLLQLTQVLTLSPSMGQTRFFSTFPASKTAIFSPGAFLVSS